MATHILKLSISRVGEIRARGPNPLCHLSLLMKFSWTTALSICFHFVWLCDSRINGDGNCVTHETKIFTFGPFMKKVCKPLVSTGEFPPLMVKILPLSTKKLGPLCIIPMLGKLFPKCISKSFQS